MRGPRRTGMKSLLAALVLGSLPLVGVGLAPPAAALSCVGPQGVLERAATIYAGRIVTVSDDEVTVEVDEVWKGAPPPREVTFDVDLPQWWEADRTAEQKGRVVVVPVEGALNPCTVFPLEGRDVAALRPFRPAHPEQPLAVRVDRQPMDDDASAGHLTSLWTWIAAGSVATLAGAGALLARQRRRSRSAATPPS